MPPGTYLVVWENGSVSFPAPSVGARVPTSIRKDVVRLMLCQLED